MLSIPSTHSLRARLRRGALAVVALLAILAAALPAAASKLDDLRKAGTVGERFDGYATVRAKGADDDVKAAVDEVNAKRREIYQKRADEEKVPVDQVGRVYAKKILDEAAEGTWFLGEDGEWKQK